MPPAIDGYLLCLPSILKFFTGLASRMQMLTHCHVDRRVSWLTTTIPEKSRNEYRNLPSNIWSKHVCHDQQTVRAVSARHMFCSPEAPDTGHALMLSLSVDLNSISDSFVDDAQVASSVLPQLSAVDIASKQRADPTIQHVIVQLESGDSPLLRDQLPDLPVYLREVIQLDLRNNLLVRKRRVGAEGIYQLVLPEKCRADVLHQLHEMGHLGMERTLDLIRSLF